jgi:hypothetical protein
MRGTCYADGPPRLARYFTRPNTAQVSHTPTSTLFSPRALQGPMYHCEHPIHRLGRS